MAVESFQHSPSRIADFLIVGAGIVGLTLAFELRQQYKDARILILEKERGLGLHASGRNSGVLHAGIYYPEGTLKAQICRDGAEILFQFCEKRKLPMRRIGKIIVPLQKGDDAQLDLLFARANQNGVTMQYLDQQALKSLEPDAQSATGRALWSPTTGSFEPKAILNHLYEELVASGVEIYFNEQVEHVDPTSGSVKTQQQRFYFGHLFNTAGLHADRIAQACGVGERYGVLPFKGLYYRLDPQSGLDIRHHIYPVPDLNMPFLGVHFTRSHAGEIFLGPTAIPAFGRENYRGLQGIAWPETLTIFRNLIDLYMANPLNFRQYSHTECLRFFKPLFVKAAQALAPKLQERHLLPCEKVGIRPQLFDRQDRSLVMDFVVVSGERSTHILNAISPAFTCSFAFAKFVLQKYSE